MKSATNRQKLKTKCGHWNAWLLAVEFELRLHFAAGVWGSPPPDCPRAMYCPVCTVCMCAWRSDAVPASNFGPGKLSFMLLLACYIYITHLSRLLLRIHPFFPSHKACL
jgi:hypothetical protein